MRKSPAGTVPNQRIREAVIESGVSTYQLCQFIGWLRGNGSPDTTRIERVLGLKPWRGRNGEIRYSRSIKEENAITIIEAIHLDPVDFTDIGL